jgi:hypothetical protein
MGGRLFRAVAVAFVNHRDFPDSQGRAHNIGVAPGIRVSKFHGGELCMPQAFFDQLSRRLAWAFVNTHGEAIQTRSLFIRRFNVDGLHADSIIPERKTSAAMFRSRFLAGQLILHNPSCLHHKLNLPKCGDVSQRIAFYGDQVGVLAGFERADAVLPTQ